MHRVTAPANQNPIVAIMSTANRWLLIVRGAFLHEAADGESGAFRGDAEGALCGGVSARTAAERHRPLVTLGGG